MGRGRIPQPDAPTLLLLAHYHDGGMELIAWRRSFKQRELGLGSPPWKAGVWPVWLALGPGSDRGRGSFLERGTLAPYSAASASQASSTSTDPTKPYPAPRRHRRPSGTLCGRVLALGPTHDEQGWGRWVMLPTEVGAVIGSLALVIFTVYGAGSGAAPSRT
jgi:hypothetical protein